METLRGNYSFNKHPIHYPDGIDSNLNFKDTKIAQPPILYILTELTQHYSA